MTIEDIKASEHAKVDTIIGILATLNDNNSAAMATTLICALWYLHTQTKKEGASFESFVKIVGNGLWEIENLNNKLMN